MDTNVEHGLLSHGEPARTRLARTITLAKKALANLALSILPTWLQSQPPSQSTAPDKARPTGYLDGLRGLVSILVFVRHFSFPWQDHLDYGYGYHQQHYNVMRLPFLRLLYAGPLVPVFFIVSGYVLSTKSLHLARKGSYESLVLALASSVFRRSLRLLAPPIASTFLVMLMAHFSAFAFPYTDMPGRQPVHPPVLDTLWDQFISWAGFVADELANPWRWDVPRLAYGPHLWTIPMSLKGSMLVFLACLMVIRAKPLVRLGILTFQVAYALSRGRWDMAPFLGGIILCELDIRKSDTDKKREGLIDAAMGPRPRRVLVRSALSFLALVLGLYVGSFPRHNRDGGDCVPGYQSFCQLTPNYRYWHGLGAFAVMWAVSCEPLLQQPMNSRVAQYFGRISFSMYLIHEPLLHVFGFFTVPFFWQVTGQATRFQYQLGFGLGMAVTAFVLVWLADLFKRVVEEPCGRMAAWVERICFTASA